MLCSCTGTHMATAGVKGLNYISFVLYRWMLLSVDRATIIDRAAICRWRLMWERSCVYSAVSRLCTYSIRG